MSMSRRHSTSLPYQDWLGCATHRGCTENAMNYSFPCHNPRLAACLASTITATAVAGSWDMHGSFAAPTQWICVPTATCSLLKATAYEEDLITGCPWTTVGSPTHRGTSAGLPILLLLTEAGPHTAECQMLETNLLATCPKESYSRKHKRRPAVSGRQVAW